MEQKQGSPTQTAKASKDPVSLKETLASKEDKKDNLKLAEPSKEMTENEKMLLRKKRFQSELTSVATTSQTEELVKQEDEKRKERAARFGIISEKEKLEARAKKFGLTSEEDKKAERLKKFGPVAGSPADEEKKKLEERAKRFGLKEDMGKLQDPVEEEKKRLRAERFGLATKGTEDDEDKKKKRLERFGKSAPSQ